MTATTADVTKARQTAKSLPALPALAALGTVAAVMGASALVAMRNTPDPLHPRIRRWYKRLDKPGFTPPDPVFGAVWPVLESGLAFGGYRLLRQPSSAFRNTAVGLWFVTTAMVGGWTQIFFGEKKLGASAIASGTMLVTGVGYVAAAAKVDRPAALAAVPFVAWLGFATLLAEQVWRRNAPTSGTACVRSTAHSMPNVRSAMVMAYGSPRSTW